MKDIEVQRGFAEAERAAAAALFWEGFRGKLHRLLGPDAKALGFLAAVLQPRFALTARRGGRLVGIAGIKTREGGLVGGTYADMRRHYGAAPALWRGALLGVLDRPLAEGELLMDGLVVAAGARGGGIGSALLTAVEETARRDGHGRVRLDVIDTNPRARALYERRGYVQVARHGSALLRPVFGFSGAATLVKQV
ncbi:MAG: GNAT family N-acetyltransferase [Shimia sp.]